MGDILKIKARKIGQQKLLFVKLIRDNTGLGLKESKDWCDKFSESLNVEHCLPISTSIEEFKNSMIELGVNNDYELIIEDKEKKRQLKLISLGLGDISDKINAISEKLSLDLYKQSYGLNKQDLFCVYEDFFKEFLLEVDENNLDKIFNKINNNG